jgi:hypothetical protein
MRLRVFRGGRAVHDEWLLSRVQLTIDGIPIHFRNLKTATEEDTASFYARDDQHKITQQVVLGTPCDVNLQTGGGGACTRFMWSGLRPR